jgi:hypothetical protein
VEKNLQPESVMKTKSRQSAVQPAPFTPGLSAVEVREHALKLYFDKLRHHQHLTLEDWVMAEKDLVAIRQSEGLLSR